MPSIVVFADISDCEVVFLNKLHEYLELKGFTLRVVVFKDYQNCIKKLKCDYIYLRSFNLLNVNLPPSKTNSNICGDNFFEKLVLREKEIKNLQQLNIDVYRRNFNGLVKLVDNLTNTTSLDIVMSRPYTTYEVVKKVLSNKGKDFVHFEKWVFANTYQFNLNGIDQPCLDIDAGVSDQTQHRLLLNDLFLSYKGRHTVNEEKAESPGKYVLLLLGDGSGAGFCLKNAEEYWSIGKGWGNDFDVLRKVEKCLQDTLPDRKLLVRQHPYTKYKFNEQQVNKQNTILANKMVLDSLIGNAEIVITVTTSIQYYALWKGKKVIVLGSCELCGSDVVKCVDSVDELSLVLTEAANNKRLLCVNKEEVINATMPFFVNQVWVNDKIFTYGVLDKYIDDRELTEDNVLVWQAEKKRILKHQAFIYIKSKLFAICNKIKIQLKKFFGELKVRQT
jgi:hypothetical protein